jgi:hypothetical protein
MISAMTRSRVFRFAFLMVFVFAIAGPVAHYARQQASNSANWDFELGTLQGWNKTGNAFDAQPTFQDNPTARNRGQASNHRGNYWIGTYEKRHGAADPPGQIQGDGPTGTLTSAPFLIRGRKMDFLIGGGCDIATERAALMIDGKSVRQATGKCTETMERVSWDVSEFIGKTAELVLIDAASGGWGHINFDDLRVTDIPDIPPVNVSDFDEWNFDEGKGTVATNTTRPARNGLLMNGASWAAGKTGDAVSFNGVDGYVIVPAALPTPGRAGSITFWFSPALELSGSTSLHQTAIEGLAENGPQGGHVVVGFNQSSIYSGTYALEFGIHNGRDWAYVKSLTQKWAAKTWYHVAVTWGSAGMKIYINGALENSNPDTRMPAPFGSNFRIGQNTAFKANGQGGTWDGLIDEVRVYDRAINDTEVRALYQVPSDSTHIPLDKPVEIKAENATLSIPKGAYERETAVRMARDASNLPRATGAVALIGNAFEIEQLTPANRVLPLTLRVSYDPASVPQGANPKALTIIWWDGKAWKEVPSDVDTNVHTVSAQIDHFSKFGEGYSWLKDQMYSALAGLQSSDYSSYSGKYVSGDFTIHYFTKSGAQLARELAESGKGGPFSGPGIVQLSARDDRPPQADANSNGIPDYVEHLAAYLNAATRVYDAGRPPFDRMKIPVAGTIHVFIQSLGFNPSEISGVKAETDPISSLLTFDNKLPDNYLQDTAAHELFHYWQNSRLWLVTGVSHRWWMEATAAWASNQVFPSLKLYSQDIKFKKPSPPFDGLENTVYHGGQSDYYAAASFVAYLEHRFPGFVMRTFDTENGLRQEHWDDSFRPILENSYKIYNLSDVIEDYFLAYYYHWDFDPDITDWFGKTGPSILAKPLILLFSSTYERVQRELPLRSAQLISLLSQTGPAKLVIRQHGRAVAAVPEVRVFATRLEGDKRLRVPVEGKMERSGTMLTETVAAPLSPTRSVQVIDSFGQSSKGGNVQEADVLAVWIRNLDGPDPNGPDLDLEVYSLQPPDGVKVERVGTERLRVSWAAATLPKGEKPEDNGALHGYAIYRQGSGTPVQVRVVNADMTSAEGPTNDFTGGLSDVNLFVRAVDKYGLEGPDSQKSLVGAVSSNSITIKGTDSVYGDITMTVDLKVGGKVTGTSTRTVPGQEPFPLTDGIIVCKYTYTQNFTYSGQVTRVDSGNYFEATGKWDGNAVRVTTPVVVNPNVRSNSTCKAGTTTEPGVSALETPEQHVFTLRSSNPRAVSFMSYGGNTDLLIQNQ